MIGPAYRFAAILLPALLLAASLPAYAEMPSYFPELRIDKASAKTEWPFAVDAGDLSCIDMGNQKFIFFAEDAVGDSMDAIMKARMVVVTTNPLALFASIEDRSLYLPFSDLETLIKRLAPYETTGRDLCFAAEKEKPN